MKRLRIATRKSRLALWQSEHVASRLRAAGGVEDVELVPLSTRGDRVLDSPLAEIGGKGLFLKELEQAVLDGRADLAVHSLKDVPAESPPGLVLAAWLERADSCDLWFDRDGTGPDAMAPGARVGTSSLRRASQLKAMYPHLEVAELRGNVETRLARLDEGRVDAVILAAAGIGRLGIQRPGAVRLEAPAWLPAPGQGVIVVQCREDDDATRRLVQAIGCSRTATEVAAERAVVAALGADCRMPLAALAESDDDRLRLTARLGSPEGRLIEARGEAPPADARVLGERLAAELMDDGGRELLQELARTS